MPAFLRYKNLTSAAVLAYGLAGCVFSKGPLFDPKDAVTPFTAGSFDSQMLDRSKWASSSIGTLSLDGQTYSWKQSANSDSSKKFTAYHLGGDFYVAAIPEKDAIVYELLQKDGNAIMIYDVTCRGILQMPILQFSPEVIGNRWGKYFETSCRFFSREALVTELLEFAQRNTPFQRFVGAEK